MWEFADPNKLLASAVNESPGLRGLFAAAIARKPPSFDRPWSLIIGFDEFVPGNKLSVDNRRKTMVLSFSFLELGSVSLCEALAWQTPVCVRASTIGYVEGGWSHMFSIFLRRQLLGPDGLATAGIPLVLGDDPNEPTLLFARLTNVLADGEGVKHGFDLKGSSGLKPCFKHFNVFKKDFRVTLRQQQRCCSTIGFCFVSLALPPAASLFNHRPSQFPRTVTQTAFLFQRSAAPVGSDRKTQARTPSWPKATPSTWKFRATKWRDSRSGRNVICTLWLTLCGKLMPGFKLELSRRVGSITCR